MTQRQITFLEGWTFRQIRQALREKGYRLAFFAPTNQIFVLLDKAQAAELSRKVEMSFWENPDEEHTVMRIATSWATTEEDVRALIECL